MNVLTNEAIKDPTAVEMKVREEVEERHLKHMQENEERKLTKEERLAKFKTNTKKILKRDIIPQYSKLISFRIPETSTKLISMLSSWDYMEYVC